MEVPKEIESRMKYFLTSEKYKFWPVFLNIPIESRRSNAATQVIKMIENDFDKQRCIDSDEEHYDEDDDDVPRDDGTALLEKLKCFITALQDAPMILGFHAVETHADANVCCYCPCSKKVQAWRDLHGLDIPLCGNGKTAHKYSPNALVAHLKELSKSTIHSNGTAIFHQYALKYIEALYENYWGNGIHHKGLYNKGDKGYDKASTEEKSRDMEVMNRLRNELAKSQQEKIEAEQRADRWEKIQLINPDLLDLKQKYEKKMDLLVRLGLAVQTESGVEIIGKKRKPLTETEIKRYETQHACFIKLCNFEFESKIGSRKAQRLQITFDDTKVSPTDDNTKGSPIDAWFMDNINKDLKSLFGDTNNFLFGDVLMNEKGVYDLFNPWEVRFQCITVPAMNAAKRVKTEHGNYSHPIDITEENDEVVATDSGGPTRSFLMKLWTQLITVNRYDGDGQPKKLFVDIGEYIVPTTDLRTQAKARPIYRAIGRTMSYCILHKELIANHVVPDMYKNYLFRDITPLDREYELSDLVNHYTEMMKLKNSYADHDESIDNIFMAYAISDEQTLEKNEDGLLAQMTDGMPPKERMFREFINNEFFKPRRIALDAMKQGIRLQVSPEPKEPCFVPCETCFSTMPIEAIRKLLFDNSGYDIDFVLSRMQRVSVPPDDERDKETLRNMEETQNVVFHVSPTSQQREGLFVDILRRKCKDNEEFIRDFVWYVTGTKYIRQSEFEIMVEFNGDETDFDWLPIVHTCANTIKLPAFAYFGNAEMLERNLDIAMKSAQACAFDMT